MLKENSLFKLIILIPILFIVLTASFITYIHVNQEDKKFESDSLKLTRTFLDEEKARVETVLESLNSYILFKKSTAENILKDRVKSRLEIADIMLMKLHNKLVGIESESSIQITLLTSLKDIKVLENGKYFIYGYDKKNQKKIDPSKVIYNENNLLNKVDNFLVLRNEGFIYFDDLTNEKENKKISNICYIKKFELSDFVIGYCENIDSNMELFKDDVLNRIDLMNFNGEIYTYDENLKIIQDSIFKDKIGKSLDDIESNKNILFLTKEYMKFSKIDFKNKTFKHYWDKIDDNNYRLLMFTYIEDWNWIVNVTININDVRRNINELIGIKQAHRDEVISESIKTAFIFILIASIVSYITSYYIYTIIRKYRQNIEKQKAVLKHLNLKLEEKVEEKTKQLEIINQELIVKFKNEVRKNRQKDELLSEQSKNASMGEMIGHIAHQWRQPLSTISIVASGNCLKIDYDMMEKDELKKDFEMIVEQASYLATTVDDFRDFFREDKGIFNFDLSQIIQKDLNLLKPIFEKNYITIINNSNYVTISSIKNEVLQAILNILNNAKDALLENKECDRLIVIDVFQDGANAIVKIQDSAGGIKKEYLPKIFEQYFSTKDKSVGTGLGLYMSKKIIENNLKGKIEVINQEFVHDDKLYYGACFIITLPINF